jgi:hypothetical protein
MNQPSDFSDNRYYTKRDHFDSYSRRWFLKRFDFNDNFYDGRWRRQRISIGHPTYRRRRNVHPAYYFSASRSEYNIRKWWRRERGHDGSVPTAEPNYSDPALRSSLRYNDHKIKAGIVIGWADCFATLNDLADGAESLAV